MLKRFFTVFLGSMAAIWLSAILFAGLILITLIMWLNSMGAPTVEPNSVLYIKLEGEVSERYTPSPLQDRLLGFATQGPSLDEMLQSIRRAKTDYRIDGIYLDLCGSEMGLAMRQELRAALIDFKESGKWVYAYADTYSQGDFYTAAIADKVYINPSGQVDASGLSVTVPFFKNALDKLGVEVQVVKVGTFKSAVEPFILTSMSEPARMQYDVMLGTMWDEYTETVVTDRGLPADSVSMFKRMAATPMFAYTADQLVDAGLVSDVHYRYQVEQDIRIKAGSGDKLNLVTPHTFLASFGNIWQEDTRSKSRHIAVLYAIGDIVDAGNYGIVGRKVAPLIVELADDDNVAGLVLRINSGGGSAFASEQIWASLEYFKSKNKPFYASMSNTAASGGYYIACGADSIYADPTTVTGSIGIFGVIPYGKELLNDKLGVNFSVVETNPNAVFPRLDAPLTPDQHKALQSSIERGYDLFVSRVAQGRHMSDADVRKIAEGRVWAGITARQIGLVDHLGGLESALKAMCQKTGVSRENVVDYPTLNISPLDMLMTMDNDDGTNDESQSARTLKALGAAAGQIEQSLEIVNRMRSMNYIQAKAEDITVK